MRLNTQDAWYTGYHTCANRNEILPNLKRYYLPHVAQAVFDVYPRLAEDATSEEATVQLGRVGPVDQPLDLMTSVEQCYSGPVILLSLLMDGCRSSRTHRYTSLSGSWRGISSVGECRL